MSRIKKTMMCSLAVVFLLAASPLFASADGMWEGTGTGSTHPPIPIPLRIDAWKYWEGEVRGDVFAGKWSDDFENGYFAGELTFSSVTEAHCKGEWYWIAANGQSYLMGSFKMIFYLESSDCEGEWKVYHDDDKGTMKGSKVE